MIATGAITNFEWQERIAGTQRQLVTMETTIRTDVYPERGSCVPELLLWLVSYAFAMSVLGMS
jgi:hypothetical protein